jgi:maltokinase
LATLETVCALDDSPSVLVARSRRDELEAILDGLGALAGTPVIEGHGDLHVGQVLRSEGRFVVTDFDGNPVLTAAERMLPIPAAMDVAGLAQSLSHAAIVARKYTDLDAVALADVDAAGRSAFERAYTDRLASLGHGGLYEPGQLRAFRTQQVLREIIYAARHLPRWMYVPDAALPALLDEGPRS